MGLFSRKKRTDIASMVCGYCRMEVQKITGIDPNSSKYDDFIRSIQQSIKPVFDILENAPDTDSTKKILTGIAQTLNGVPGNRQAQMMGDVIILYWLRVGITQKAVVEGRVSKEEADPDIVLSVVHGQVKNIIKQFS